MEPHDFRRPFKRPAISDQQRRREVALHRQSQQRSDTQNRARRLASSVLSLPDHSSPTDATHAELCDITEVDSFLSSEQNLEPSPEPEAVSQSARDLNVFQASKLRGSEARHWFARQLMLPEWMIDVPPDLDRDWYVFARPAGKRCFVVSSNGSTVSRLRNGSVLHHFPSSLPNGARAKEVSAPSHVYCLLDCIFHEVVSYDSHVVILIIAYAYFVLTTIYGGAWQPDQTYYVIDIVCWRGYSLYECSAEFRFFWLNSKLSETGAGYPPSTYHRYRFGVVPIYECNHIGLHTAYASSVSYVKDGLLFYNKHAHYQTGNTPLALAWKDECCSHYLLDTDSKGQVPAHQQVVLVLQNDGKLTTSDDPPVILCCLDREFQQKAGLQPGNLLRFTITDECVRVVDGKLELGEIKFVGNANRARAFADSYSKVFFQYTARHSPLQFQDILAFIHPNSDENSQSNDIEMAG